MLGAVLVGGRSSRMGRDKALIEVEDVPMARRVAAAMADAGIERIVAVGPARLAAGLEVVEDRHPGEGPLGAIVTALAAARPGPVLVVACDLAWIDAASLTALIEAAHDGVADVVVGRTDRIEPLCALWSSSAAEHLVSRFGAGERAVHRAMAGLVTVEVELRLDALRNANTPDDLPLSTVRSEGAHHGDIRDQHR